MASSVKKEVKTPELIPWMPPGKKDSFNVLTTKKNSKQELPEFGKSNAQDIFGNREGMDESRKTEDARRDMESKILSVLEEDDEDFDEDGRRRKRSESADR